MADPLAKGGGADFPRSVAEAVLQLPMEADAEGPIGAGRRERTGERLNCRNGFRDRASDTRLGTLRLRVPKLRQGSCSPPFPDARKTSEKAPVAVVQEAWVGGVSTRKVDGLVRAMGLAGIPKSTASKLREEIDERAQASLERPLAGEWPHLWLDATCLRQRGGGRVVSVAATIAAAVDAEGRRGIVGPHIGPSEAETFWAAFLRGLAKRGLRGAKPVVSDAREGLEGAIARVLGAARRRCRARRMRNALAHVPKGQRTMVAAALRRAFLQPDQEGARQAWRHVADQPRPRRPDLGALVDEGGHDVLAYMAFPAQRRAKLHSTNPPERLNKEVKRRADAVGIFPNEASIVRLVGAVLLEADDEWRLQHRYTRAEGMAEPGVPPVETETPQLPPRAA